MTDAFYGILIPFLGTSLGTASVFFLKQSLGDHIQRALTGFAAGVMVAASVWSLLIIHFVQLEALNWCKTAIPIGCALGTVTCWVLCLILRFVVKGEWVDMPLFAVSASGILSGAVAGVVTVFIAAHSPARQAARVSPAAVVSGNADTAAHYAAQTADRVLQVSDGCLTDFGRCQEKPVPDDRFLCADDRAVSGVFGLSGYRAQVSALGEQPSHAGFFPSTAWMTPIPSTPPWLTKLRLCPA